MSELELSVSIDDDVTVSVTDTQQLTLEVPGQDLEISAGTEATLELAGGYELTLGSSGSGGGYEEDNTLPPEWLNPDPPPFPVHNLTVLSGFTTISLYWTLDWYGWHRYVEIWRSETDDIASARKVGASIGNAYSDPVETGKDYFYWARPVTQRGVVGEWQAVAGAPGNSREGVDGFLEALRGKLHEGLFDLDTQGAFSELGSLSTELLQETQDRLASIADEQAAREASLQQWAAELRAERATEQAGLEERAMTSVEQESIQRTGQHDAFVLQLNDLLAALNTERDQRIAAITEERQALTNSELAQAAINTELTALVTGESSTRIADIEEERLVRVTELEAMATQLYTVSAAFNTEQADRIAAIQDEQSARATDMEAVAAQINVVTTAIADETSDRIAAVSSEQTARTDADSALTTSVNALAATVTSNKSSADAAIALEQTTRADATGALATQLDALTTSFDNNVTATSAAIAAEQTARSDADGALSSSIDTVKATVEIKPDTYSQSGAPATPKEGDYWYDTTNKVVKRFDGTSWVAQTQGWDQVEGGGKPADNATVGADWSSNVTNKPRVNLSNFAELFELDNSMDDWTYHSGTAPLTIHNTDGVTGGKCLKIDNNTGDTITILTFTQPIPFDPDALYRIQTRIRVLSGEAHAYLGWMGLAADGVTMVNLLGHNAITAQYYHGGGAIDVPGEWTLYTGYTKGADEVFGNAYWGSLETPGMVHPDVRYVCPLLYFTYANSTGVIEVDSMLVDTIVDGTSSLYDDAGLGSTADWDQVSGEGKPVDNATVNNTFAQDASPTTGMVDGDFWVDTTNGTNKLYRYNGTIWVDVQDADAKEARAKVTTWEEATAGIDPVTGNLVSKALWEVSATADDQVGSIGLVSDGQGGTEAYVKAGRFQVYDPANPAERDQVFVVENGKVSMNTAYIDEAHIKTLAAGEVTVENLSADSLSAITADMGTITAGLMQSADGKMKIDLNNKYIYIEI
jgi:hypothetical protein